MKKKTKIIIPILIVILAAIIGTLLYLYYATNIFKSNKELFFNNAKQSVKILSQTDFGNSIETRKNNSYTQELKLDVEMPSIEEGIKPLEFKIQKSSDKIGISGKLKGDKENFPYDFVLTKEDVLFKFSEVENKYISLSLLDLLEDNDMEDNEQYLDMLFDDEASDSKFAELTQIGSEFVSSYITYLATNISNDNFEKINDGKDVSYELKITQKEILELLKGYVQTSEFEGCCFKLYSWYNSDIDETMIKTNISKLQEDIQTQIDEMGNEDNYVYTFEITNLNGKYILKVSVAENCFFTFENTYSENNQEIKIVVNQVDNGNDSIEIIYTGENLTSNPQEELTIVYNSGDKTQAKIVAQSLTTYNMDEEISKEDIKKIDINDEDDMEELKEYFSNFEEKIYDFTKNNTPEDLLSQSLVMYVQLMQPVDSLSLESQATTTFNNQFLQYQGDRVKGSVVKTLVNKVKSSNASSEDQVYIYIYDGSKYVDVTSSDIATNNYYKISMYTNNATQKVDKIYIDPVD